ncbi:MAG: hypothetical protein WBJ81_01630 [Rickettsiales bacterium]
MLNKYLLVTAGGGVGVMARFALCNLLPSVILTNFPLQILVVNILGCGAMQAIAAFYLGAKSIRIFVS